MLLPLLLKPPLPRLYNRRRSYRQLRCRKSRDFWRSKIEADQSDPRKLWRSVDVLLERGCVLPSSATDVETFNQFFADKVANVRSSTSDTPLPAFSRVRDGVSFRTFSKLTINDVLNAVRLLPDKSSAADPIPTSVLKRTVDLIAPFIVELFNRSLSVGRFPAGFKNAFISPIVKKPGLDVTDVSSY
jgi:hypothetical protein